MKIWKADSGSSGDVSSIPFVKLPTSYFSFLSADKSLVTIDEKKGNAIASATGTNVGKTQLTVRDNRIENNSATSVLSVALPTAMRIVIRPGDKSEERNKDWTQATMEEWSTATRY